MVDFLVMDFGDLGVVDEKICFLAFRILFLMDSMSDGASSSMDFLTLDLLLRLEF